MPTPGDARPWPLQVIDQFTATTGRPMIPPAWSFGPRRRINRETIDRRRAGDAGDARQRSRHHRRRRRRRTSLPDGSDIGNEATLRAWVQSGTDARLQDGRLLQPVSLGGPGERRSRRQRKKGVANNYFLENGDGTPSQRVAHQRRRASNVYTVDVTNAGRQRLVHRARSSARSTSATRAGCTTSASTCSRRGPRVERHDRRGAPQPVSRALRQGGARRARADAAGRLVLLLALRLHRLAAVRADGVVGRSRRVVRRRRRAARAGARRRSPRRCRASRTGARDIGGYKCLRDGGAGRRRRAARALDRSRRDVVEHARRGRLLGRRRARRPSGARPTRRTAWRTYARLHTRMLPYLFALAAARARHRRAAGAQPVARCIPSARELAPVGDAFYFGPSLFAAPVVDARRRRQDRRRCRPALFVDWHDRRCSTAAPAAAPSTVPAPLDKLPLLLVDGTLVPLLDPTIDTARRRDQSDDRRPERRRRRLRCRRR